MAAAVFRFKQLKSLLLSDPAARLWVMIQQQIDKGLTNDETHLGGTTRILFRAQCSGDGNVYALVSRDIDVVGSLNFAKHQRLR